MKDRDKDSKIFLRHKPRYVKSDAVRELEQLAMAAARLRYPTMPYLCPRLYRDDSANNLTRCIIDFLRLSGWQAERTNSTGRYLDGSKIVTDCLDRQMKIGSGKWIPGSGQKGASDISATIRGRSVKIEVKTRDCQSPAQKKYQDMIEKAGGVYYVVKDFESFKIWFDTIQ